MPMTTTDARKRHEEAATAAQPVTLTLTDDEAAVVVAALCNHRGRIARDLPTDPNAARPYAATESALNKARAARREATR